MKTRKLTFYADPGHGWLKVDLLDCIDLDIADKISRYSYTKGTVVYLEEDCDAGLFLDSAKNQGWTINIKETYQENTPIRNYANYTPKLLKILTGA
jgi:hypothetical protein